MFYHFSDGTSWNHLFKSTWIPEFSEVITQAYRERILQGKNKMMLGSKGSKRNTDIVDEGKSCNIWDVYELVN